MATASDTEAEGGRVPITRVTSRYDVDNKKTM